MKNKQNNFFVFQLWVAKGLASKGFSYTTRTDLKNNSRLVFIFKDSPELRVEFDKLITGLE